MGGKRLPVTDEEMYLQPSDRYLAHATITYHRMLVQGCLPEALVAALVRDWHLARLERWKGNPFKGRS